MENVSLKLTNDFSAKARFPKFFPNTFFPNHKFYYNETLHEGSMPSRKFKNSETWAVVIVVASSIIQSKIVLLKKNYFPKNNS